MAKRPKKPESVTYAPEDMRRLVVDDAASKLGVPSRRVGISADAAGNWVAMAEAEPPHPVGPYVVFGGGGRVMVVVGSGASGNVHLEDPFHPAGTYPLKCATSAVSAAASTFAISEYARLGIRPPDDIEQWLGWSAERAIEYAIDNPVSQ